MQKCKQNALVQVLDLLITWSRVAICVAVIKVLEVCDGDTQRSYISVLKPHLFLCWWVKSRTKAVAAKKSLRAMLPFDMQHTWCDYDFEVNIKRWTKQWCIFDGIVESVSNCFISRCCCRCLFGKACSKEQQRGYDEDIIWKCNLASKTTVFPW